jgi:hypothetical protein
MSEADIVRKLDAHLLRLQQARDLLAESMIVPRHQKSPQQYLKERNRLSARIARDAVRRPQKTARESLRGKPLSREIALDLESSPSSHADRLVPAVDQPARQDVLRPAL